MFQLYVSYVSPLFPYILSLFSFLGSFVSTKPANLKQIRLLNVGNRPITGTSLLPRKETYPAVLGITLEITQQTNYSLFLSSVNYRLHSLKFVKQY